jgi:hypothetical protein
MLICYALEDRSHWFVLAFAGACVLGSAYGFCGDSPDRFHYPEWPCMIEGLEPNT